MSNRVKVKPAKRKEPTADAFYPVVCTAGTVEVARAEAYERLIVLAGMRRRGPVEWRGYAGAEGVLGVLGVLRAYGPALDTRYGQLVEAAEKLGDAAVLVLAVCPIAVES